LILNNNYTQREGFQKEAMKEGMQVTFTVNAICQLVLSFSGKAFVSVLESEPSWAFMMRPW
jgi:hypothetical protein